MKEIGGSHCWDNDPAWGILHACVYEHTHMTSRLPILQTNKAAQISRHNKQSRQSGIFSPTMWKPTKKSFKNQQACCQPPRWPAINQVVIAQQLGVLQQSSIYRWSTGHLNNHKHRKNWTKCCPFYCFHG